MAEGAVEVDTLSSAELSASGGAAAGGDMDLPAQLDNQLELHVDANRDLLLVEGSSVQNSEMEVDGIVTEPVLGMRMLMSSRVSNMNGGSSLASCDVYYNTRVLRAGRQFNYTPSPTLNC